MRLLAIGQFMRCLRVEATYDIIDVVQLRLSIIIQPKVAHRLVQATKSRSVFCLLRQFRKLQHVRFSPGQN